MDKIRDIRGRRGEACGGFDRSQWWYNIRGHHLLILEEENQNRADTKQRAKLRCNKMRNTSVQQAIMTTAEDSVLLPLASPCITHARNEKRGGKLKHSCIAASPTFPHSTCDREPRTRRMVWCACLQQLVICLVARLSPDKGMCVCVVVHCASLGENQEVGEEEDKLAFILVLSLKTATQALMIACKLYRTVLYLLLTSVAAPY